MKIFLSWSGSASRAYAHKAQEFLGQVMPWAAIYLSDDDIESGERWLINISSALEGSSYGIIFLTAANKAAPWVLIEAGALSKSISDSRVVPLLCGIEDIDLTGNPLSQFQYRKLVKSDVERLVKDINSKSDVSVPWERLSKTFEKFWPDFEPEFLAIQTANEHDNEERVVAGRQKGQGRIEVEQLQESLNEILRAVRSQQRSSTSPRNALLDAAMRSVSQDRIYRDGHTVVYEDDEFVGLLERDGDFGELIRKSTGKSEQSFMSENKTLSVWHELFVKAAQRERKGK